eukprot:TRINITY_DN12092_c0_g2_i1.p1 TRINITY_DN12092_c0_g2~~TRINITY_DN12092_c0_g2_i1.p1  ORF type:complete len:578 (+),score=111.58 TRINITY_DN12092_c0_g2_i1:70-1803(+)
MCIRDRLKRYGIKIEHKRQPLLLHEVCKKGYHKGVEHLVPELCTLVGVPDSVKMNGSISKKISNKTKPKLSVKKKKLAAFLNIFSEKEKVKEEEVNDKEEKKMGGAKSDYKLPKDILEEWNLKVNLVPTKANARTTLSVNVMLDNNATMSAIRAAPMNQILKPVMIKEWLIVHHIDKEAQAAQFTEAISRKAEEFGISMEHPTRKATETISCQGYIDAMEEHIKDGGKPQIVVCILSTKSPSDYNEIKKWAITRSSFIQTQIVRSTTLDNKKEKPYHYSNILLQMNAKMGAELWRVDQLKKLPAHTMIVGINIAGNGSVKYMGMAATLNSNFSSYYTQVRKEEEKEPEKEEETEKKEKRKGKKEKTEKKEEKKKEKKFEEEVSKLVRKAIINFKRKNNVNPELIVVYRNGIGVGRRVERFKIEYEGILNQLEVMSPKPKFIYATIGKKHNIKLFKGLHENEHNLPIGANEFSKVSESGSIINTGIINSKQREFLIMLQNTKFGSMPPTRVQIIHGSDVMPQTDFEDLTNTLCYGYDSWHGPMHVPAPCKYASACAKMIAKCVKDEPNKKLNGCKYYL